MWENITLSSHIVMEDREDATENRNISSLSDDEKENLLLLHSAELLENITQLKEKYRKIIHAGIAQWVKDFQSGHIKVNTVDDLKKLIELDIELQKDEEI